MARILFLVVVALVVGLRLVGGEVAGPREGKTGHGTQNNPSLSGPCFSSPTGLWCGSDCPARCELEVEYRADAIRVLDAYMSFEATLSLVNRRAVQVALGAIQGHSKAGSCRGRSSLGRR